MKLRKTIVSLALAVLLCVALAVPAFAATYQQDISQGKEGCNGTSHKPGADSWNVRNAWKEYINRDSDSLEQGLIDPSLMVKWLSEPNSWIVVDYECPVVPIIQTQDSAENWSLPESQTEAYASSATKAVFKMEDIYANYLATGLTQATWGNLSVMSGTETDVLKVTKVVFYIGEAPDLTGLTVASGGEAPAPAPAPSTSGSKNPGTGDNTMLFTAIAALVAALSASFVLIRKKAVK